jgi:GrpB-like predicted nucleotidyltransferase (UPF0157 family)
MTEENPFPGLVGAPELHDSTIYLAPYDPAWPLQFIEQERRVRGAIGDKALVLEHAGSTSVRGLSAKPVIDIVLAVADTTDEASYVPALLDVGYELRGREPDWHEHRLFRDMSPRTNLHVFTIGCREIPRMLEFRDHLRSNEEDRLLYERKKQQLAQQTWKYVQHYADAKSAVVEEIIGRTSAAGATCAKY